MRYQLNIPDAPGPRPGGVFMSRLRAMRSTAEARQRLVILAEGEFGEIGSKTAMGVIRYGRDVIVAVLDSTRAGGNVRDVMGEGYDIPIVASLAEALPGRPTALLLGTAPPGGKLPPSWRAIVEEAIEVGLDVRSGLHTLLGDDPGLAAAAAAADVEIVDYRRPPAREEVSTGRAHLPGKRVILTVGTDCALGKMSVALELRKAALEAGLAAVFVPTGQTGMMIDGWGVAVDRVISDFLDGTCEWLVEQAEAMGDWIFVEGQGSIDHPAYSRRDARSHPRLRTARDGPRPSARADAPPRLGDDPLRAAPDARADPPARAAGRPHGAVRRGGRGPQHVAPRRERRATRDRAHGRRARPAVRRSRTGSVASACSTRCASDWRERPIAVVARP